MNGCCIFAFYQSYWQSFSHLSYQRKHPIPLKSLICLTKWSSIPWIFHISVDSLRSLHLTVTTVTYLSVGSHISSVASPLEFLALENKPSNNVHNSTYRLIISFIWLSSQVFVGTCIKHCFISSNISSAFWNNRLPVVASNWPPCYLTGLIRLSCKHFFTIIVTSVWYLQTNIELIYNFFWLYKWIICSHKKIKLLPIGKK